MPPKGSTTRFQPPPQSLSPPPVQQDDKHDILSVVDFVDALDALPIELTKGYGDLRELDAVLHSTLVNLTEKLHLLISLVTDKTAHPSTRFQLLQEIAEEAARFKLGGDDKIRVAGGACDGIATHQKHISALLRNSSLLIPCLPTHEETLSYQSTVPQSTNKRAAASRANNSPFYQPGETPTKKKRAKPTALSALATGASINDDDDDGMSSKAKKAAKEKEREKKKKRSALGRALSPSESVASAHGTPALGSSSRHESARNPRAAAARARYADRAMSDEDDEEDDEPPLASTSKGRGTANDDSRTNGHGKAKAAEHETQDQFAGRTARQRAAAAAAAAASNKRTRPDDDDDDEDEDDEPEAKPLPASRKHDALDGKLHLDEDDGDVEMDSGEVDTKAYCHCGGVSYGEMIGCDDEDCEIEWYHLACINLTSTPSGTWYCPSCTARRLHSKPKAKPARRGRGGGKAGKAGKGRGD